MIIHNVEQYSPEWWKLRSGSPTASEFHRIVMPSGGVTRSETRNRYMYKLIAERLIGCPSEPIKDFWIERGHRLEGEAAQEFYIHTGLDVIKTGFVVSGNGRWGCSPDRLVVNKNQIVEIKCPAPWTHVGYLLDGPGEQYKPQVQGQMLVCNVEAVHFFSYHPNMPALHIVTERDESYCKILERRLNEFCDLLDAETERARKMGRFTPYSDLTFPWQESA